MIKIAHLILAHSQPLQVARLISRIRHANATIFIHIDRKQDIAPFFEAIGRCHDIVYIRNRQRIQWGGFSIVRATLGAFEEIQTHHIQFEYINLLSGSDYPLTAPSNFITFLSESQKWSFMRFEQRGTSWWNEAQDKVFRYHLTDFRFPGKHLLEVVINRITPVRKLPMGAEYVGRSQWFTLRNEHAKYILQFVVDHPEWMRYFKYTWGADEIFFQTLLYNSPYREKITNNDLRYVDWGEGKSSPKILTMEDWHVLKASSNFFARKFDSDVDSNVLDNLDNLIGYSEEK